MRSSLQKTIVLVLIIFTGLAAHATEDKREGVLILGGTRGLGLETVKLLDSRNKRITVMVRTTSDLTELNKTRAQQVVGDALNRSEIDAALESDHFHAVIASLPGTGSKGSQLDINAIDAATSAGISRYILISSVGVGDSENALPWIVRMILRTALRNKDIAERHLTASGMNYTIIRPGNLTNEKPSGKGYLTEDRSIGSAISRSEAARLIIEALGSSAAKNKTYTAIEKE